MVVPKKGAIVIEKDLIAYCRERLAAFKCPKRILITDKLPKNPSGKILKRELKQELGEIKKYPGRLRSLAKQEGRRPAYPHFHGLDNASIPT